MKRYPLVPEFGKGGMGYDICPFRLTLALFSNTVLTNGTDHTINDQET